MPYESGHDWECVGCNTIISAVVIDGCPQSWYANVRRLPSTTAQEVRETLQARGAAKRARPPLRNLRCAWETDLSRSMDAQISSGLSLILPNQGEPFAARIRRHGGAAYDPIIAKTLLDEYVNAVQRVTEEFSSLMEGGRAQISVLRTMAAQLLQHSAEDVDLLVCLSVIPGDENYLGRHSLHVAILSMAIGASLGYDDRTLEELGLGCLVHDSGMQRIRGADFLTTRILDRHELELIATHPLHTCEMLREQLAGMSPIPQMVAYQMHERCNGSGYPRGCQAHQIHPLAKIAALADAYVALCSPRPHRPAMMPYYAVLTLLQELREGAFDVNAMRGLLKTISLFPIGSYLDLGDGMIGKVIRANPLQYDRPVVEAWPKAQPNGTPVVIDLACERPDLSPLPMVPPESSI
jgi:HD-GYP domain-containing protein (c-di-GMP phosphodiesterase class II)